MKFSIIIPTLNEEKIIQSRLSALQKLKPECEIIIADGGSHDNTLALAGLYADKVVSSEPGRGIQMNNGARHATGDVLLFLHADTVLPDNALPLIKHALNSARQWGRFDICFSGRHFMFCVIAQMMNWRSALTGIATGDQAIFVTNMAFNEAGKYPEIGLMEDIALCGALKKISPPACLKAKVISSSRRWEVNGIYQTILLMWGLRLRYFFGSDPESLAYLYDRGHIWRR